MRGFEGFSTVRKEIDMLQIMEALAVRRYMCCISLFPLDRGIEILYADNAELGAKRNERKQKRIARMT